MTQPAQAGRPLLLRADAGRPVPLTLAALEVHHCAVFGGRAAKLCENFPLWIAGFWKPPQGATSLQIMLIGGGGGGGGSIEQGIGGNGGCSGEVVLSTIPVDGRPVLIRIGKNGAGGPNFRVFGRSGGNSYFGLAVAHGGRGGAPFTWGNAPPSSGGGGAGGGFYQDGMRGGRGGDGGSGGTDGAAGLPGTDTVSAVHGTSGGVGSAFPQLHFTHAAIQPGGGGKGGMPGSNLVGYGGDGGGGGGGILVANDGGEALAGAGGRAADEAQGGAGGAGYGAGGGGGGNYVIGAHGGDGAAGVVYVEWSDNITLLQRPSSIRPINTIRDRLDDSKGWRS